MEPDDATPPALILELGSDTVPPGEFLSVVRAFTGLLQDVAHEAGGPPLPWQVWVSQGSLQIVAGLPSTTDAETVSRVMGVVNSPPNRIRQRLDTFPRPVPVTRLLAGEDRRDLLVDRQEGSARHPSQIAEYGTVEGTLDTLSARGRRPHFTISEPIWNMAVQCTVPDQLVEAMRGMWRQRVSARGMVHYDREGLPTSIRAEEVELFPYDETPIGEYRGLLAAD